MHAHDESGPDRGAEGGTAPSTIHDGGPHAQRRGILVSIHVTGFGGAAMAERERVRAVPGRGLEGDRYFEERGTWSRPDLWSEVTLVAVEAVERASRVLDRSVDPGSLRRNLVTRGIDLDGLVGRLFRIGSVVLRGERPCDPCGYLEEQTGVPGLKDALRKQGGLRATVVQEGLLETGCEISILPEGGEAE